MERNILNSFLAIIFAGTFVGCAAKKLVVTPPPAVMTEVSKVDKNPEYFNLLASKNFTFNTLLLKGKAHINLDGDENNVSVNVRIKNKEMIWISVSAIIGEVARVSITPDSIRIINRLENTYTTKPFSFINDFSSSKISFTMLQDILSGNLITELVDPNVPVIQQDGVFSIKGGDEDVSYTFLFNTLLRVQETDLNRVRTGQALKVIYADYHQLAVGLFPTSISINSMSGVKKTNINLNFTSIEGNVPLEFPFTVKPHFKVIN